MKTYVSIHNLVEVVNSFISGQNILTRYLNMTGIAAKYVPHLLTDMQQENHINVHQDLQENIQRPAVPYKGHHMP
jgi:hypothetical protein